jgi:hypothetical protein
VLLDQGLSDLDRQLLVAVGQTAGEQDLVQGVIAVNRVIEHFEIALFFVALHVEGDFILLVIGLLNLIIGPVSWEVTNSTRIKPMARLSDPWRIKEGEAVTQPWGVTVLLRFLQILPHQLGKLATAPG